VAIVERVNKHSGRSEYLVLNGDTHGATVEGCDNLYHIQQRMVQSRARAAIIPDVADEPRVQPTPYTGSSGGICESASSHASASVGL
jgi:hypothetical protein